MTTTMDTLIDSDFIRFPAQAATRPLPFKEWHHFVVQRDELRVLINFSLLVEGHGGGPERLSPQVIVLVHGAQDESILDRPEADDFSISSDLRSMRIGSSHMWICPTGYRVQIHADDGRIQADLNFVPTSKPFIVNNQPVGRGRLSWLFVPHLVASGWITTENVVYQLDNEIAYHDHNWGHMCWGDDFSWMWGSALPRHLDGWTAVAMRMTDRHCHRSFAQALYLWKGAEPVGVFRDNQLTLHQGAPLRAQASGHLPPIIRALAPASSDVPAMLSIHATDGDDQVQLTFASDRYTRIGFPDELTTNRICLLDEASGNVNIAGSIDGVGFAQDCPGFFEFCHG